MDTISIEHVRRKAAVINRDFGLDIEIERYNGACRATLNKQSKNLTVLTTKRDLWNTLDAIETVLYHLQRKV